MVQPIRVLIADDSVRTREGLRAFFATLPELTIVGEASDGQEAVQLAAECHPDVVLLDLHMPVLDGIQALQHIKQMHPAIAVVVLTMYADERGAVLANGADAFVVKGSGSERLLMALGVHSKNAP